MTKIINFWSIETTLSPEELEQKSQSVYISTTVGGRKLSRYMQDTLDLVNHKDYEYIINQKLNGRYIGVLILLTLKATARFVQSGGGHLDFSRSSIRELKKKGYELFK